jgi:NAD(P)-dependent dehydrogenase (short-subunit alcohol dehydrogenase family)
MQFDFSGRKVLVSGGTSGIGAALAAGFAGAGAEVVAAGLPGPVPAPGGITELRLDVRDAAAVADLAHALGRLDILVNAAGIIRRDEEFDPAVFADVVDINLNGSMRLCAACRPLLAASRGAIVNLASMLSFFGGGRVPAYSASKGGVAQLTRSLAIAFALHGIRVNAVAPGWIETPLTAGLVADPARSAAILERTPLGRWGQPGDIVGPVMFLCSPAAAFVTGVILPVDGGYLVS